MRDIEYRGLNQFNELVYFTLIDLVNGDAIPCEEITIQQDSWQQFTGLLDSKGNKVFEGGILGGGDSVPRSVFFDNGSFRLNHGDNLSAAQVMVQFTVGKLTIIGNIYEHPHLIKRDE